MKKLFLVFLGSMLLVSSIMPAPVSAVSHVNSLRLQVQDSFGLPIADASAWLCVYVKGSPVLQHEGKTDSQGTVVAKYSPSATTTVATTLLLPSTTCERMVQHGT